MQHKPKNKEHNQHHNRRNRQTGNVALAKLQEGIAVTQIADRVTISINKSQATENCHRSQRCDERCHLAVGNNQAVDTAERRTNEAGQHDTKNRIHAALDKAAHKCAGQRQNTADRQVNAAGQNNKGHTKRNQCVDRYLTQQVFQVAGVNKAAVQTGNDHKQRYQSDYRTGFF